MKRIMALILLSIIIIFYVAPYVGHEINNSNNTNNLISKSLYLHNIATDDLVIVEKPEKESNKIKALGVTVDAVTYDAAELDVVDVIEVTSSAPLETDNIEENTIIEEDIVEDFIPCPTQDPKPTIYNTYSESELHLLYQVVEAETRGKSFEVKCNVVSVIFNRVATGWGTLKEVLLKPGQFTCITNGDAYKVTITDETIAACEYVFENGDTTYGSMYFNTIRCNSWASRNKTWVMRDNVHNFYK